MLKRTTLSARRFLTQCSPRRNRGPNKSQFFSLWFFLQARDLVDPVCLDAVNSLLVCGEYPLLFTSDELDGLLMVMCERVQCLNLNTVRAYGKRATPQLPLFQALQPRQKRRPAADVHKHFVSQVKSNLHIVICLPPSHSLLSQAPR